MKTITALVVRAIDVCTQYAWPVIAAAILLTVVSSWYAATHFAMTTDVNQLISPNIPWRQREAALEKAFPQFETIVAVIDAPTPELVDEATDALVARLSQQKDLFHSIVQLKGGSFFAQNGLLFETDRRSRAAIAGAHAGATPDPGAGRRPVAARHHSGFAIRPARRAGRPAHARQHDLAADARCQRARQGQCRAAGEFLMARAGAGPRVDAG